MMLLIVASVALTLLILFSFSRAAFTSVSSVACYHIRLQVRYVTKDKTFEGSEASGGLGLLRGVNPIADDFYANEIDTSEQALAWLSRPGLMWEAAIKDATEKEIPVNEYIQLVKSKIKAFGKSGIIYDRVELLGHLNDAFTDNGSFTFVLGGKNVGKSTVLNNLCKIANSRASNVDAMHFRKRLSAGVAKGIPRMGGAALNMLLGRRLEGKSTKLVSDASNNAHDLLVLYVDARRCPGRLEEGLANGVAQLAAEILLRTPDPVNWVELLRGLFPLGRDAAIQSVVPKGKAGDGNFLRKTLELIFDFVLNPRPGDSNKLSQNLLNEFIEIARFRKSFPVLVIDEANEVLAIENDCQPGNQTRNLLTNLVSYTKQHRILNVILASSEHAYPYRLEREGFNLQNVGKLIFAGEIAPKDMWRLLVSATYEEGDNKGNTIIGMGPHLAKLCLAAYGGHFWIVEHAVQGLSLEQDKAKASTFLPNLRPNIIKCLDINSASRPLLEAMAKFGFAPVDKPESSAARLISANNVGGVVTENAACIGISEGKWEETDCEFALIPLSQSVRLRIAKVLLTRRNYMQWFF